MIFNMIKKFYLFIYFICFFGFKDRANSISHLESLPENIDTLAIRGFCISVPLPNQIDSFVLFIKKALVPRHVNTLILRVGYQYQYKSHPELVGAHALSEQNVKKIVNVCKNSDIQLIPEIDLVGHQSWHSHLNKLLEVYPEFDETPWIKMPKEYKWPNPNNLYCKSYCSLAPGLHKILFDLIDELCDVFEANAFHGGMDEIFYIAMRRNPLDGGMDPAKVLADEITRIDNHLKANGKQLWIWGDRLIDGKTTGIGRWRASMNNTYRAINMIPKDVIICDWHYDYAVQTPVLFATKGFHVVSCPRSDPDVGVWQVEDMYKFRRHTTPKMRPRYSGIVQTVWSDVGKIMRQFYAEDEMKDKVGRTIVCFKRTFDALNMNKGK